MAHKAIKYRLYPNKAQEELFKKTFGCCRKIWNLMLNARQEEYTLTGKSSQPTPAGFKAEYPFLKEVDSTALVNVQQNMKEAYTAFFERRSGFPKYKSRHKSRRAYTSNCINGNISIGENYIRLPKAGQVKAVIHRLPSDGWNLKKATVSQEPDGKYYVSVIFEYEAKPAVQLSGASVGLDYKSDGLYVDSNGHTCGSPKYFRKSAAKLARAQRVLSRRQGSRKGETKSASYLKQKEKVDRIYAHIRNQRKDFLHKESAAIAKRYDIVCVEDLNMRSLSNKGFGNGKATMDNGYGMFLEMLNYKLADKGGMLVRINKWYPSSQVCSCCGVINPTVKNLAVRTWICPECGAAHDRDMNAAVNILREGTASLCA